jgi:hypothetical protein
LPTITSDCYFRRHTFFCNLRYYVLVPRIRVIEVIFITHDLCSVVRAAGLPGFLGTRYRNQTKCTKWTQNVPNEHKMYQMNTKCTKWTQNVPIKHKMYQMVIKYPKISAKNSKWPYNICINIYQSKALQKWPELGFLVWKQTIWQPWRAVTGTQ